MTLTTCCRVCLAEATEPWQSIRGRDYRRCPDCQAVFLEDAQLPNLQDERDRYIDHENDTADVRYRSFLNRLAAPLLERLEPAREGLDYGCGPGPALADMLSEAGHTVRLYDPFFQPDPSALERTYDFITCSETAEHFHRPAEEFARLDSLLRPGGWLAVMTCFRTEDELFADWHYRRDLTHVVFYREETFHHLAARYDWHCEIPEKNVVLMRKKDSVALPV